MAVLHLDNYDVTIGPLGQPHADWLAARKYAGLAVLMDDNTLRDCWPLLEPLLAAMSPQLIVVRPGEQHKTLETCQYIWRQLFDMGAGRNWCLINMGGGVLGDMGGFCAATYKRGMAFVQVPTTLLSQVDASVGGKLGIDFCGVKNSIGVFQDPIAVWADARFFETLPARELRSGFAEIIKHALIADAGQWRELCQIDDLSTVDWTDWVARSVAVKQAIVRADPQEKGLRKALNFGHTVGHAVESYFLATDAPLLHGEAVAIGMVCEAWLSVQQQTLGQAEYADIRALLLRVYGHQPVPLQAWPELLATMRQDKKNEDAGINFSLLTSIGAVRVNEICTPEAILESLTHFNEGPGKLGTVRDV